MPLSNALRRLKSRTDYKFQSPNITFGVILVINVLLTVNLIVELAIDLQTTPKHVIVWFWVLGVVLLLVYRKWPQWSAIPVIVTAFIYLLTEIIFFTNPKSFHLINFWMVFVPLVALILQGIRASLIWTFVILATYLVNTYRISSLFGNHYDIVVKKELLITHLAFLLGIISVTYLLYKLLTDAYREMREKTDELDKLHRSMTEKKQQLEDQQQSLITLNRNKVLYEDDMPAIYRIVCTTALQQLKISRVSIWVFQNGILKRNYLLEASGGTDELAVLRTEDYPAYFLAIHTKPVIMADNAVNHEDTYELTETYLKPLNIVSMLDCPIKIGGKTIGIICCEQQKNQRAWQPEEALYVQLLANILAMCHQNKRIKDLLRQIRNQNQELLKKSNSIEAMNEELTSLNNELISLNDQLTGTNEQLEEAVKKRTEELETQNKQLTEYAFINSHLLRAPLARLLGLSQLVSLEVSSVKDRELITALQHSAKELDEIVRKITEILYAGNPISREDIKAIVDKNLNRLN